MDERPASALSRAALYLLPLLAFLVLSAATLGFVVEKTGGPFAYALDDAYIHLALARSIGLEGHYGLQPGEVTAPSSSILWPFLLAPFAGSSRFVLAPALLNLGSLLLFLVCAQSVLRRALRPETSSACFALGVLGCGWPLGLNLVGLGFTGMEHGVQLLACALLIKGLQNRVLDRPSLLLLALGIVLGPAVRYELLGASLLSCLILWRLGQRARGALLGAAALIVVIGFSLFLHGEGLGYLPTSVEAKLSSFDAGPLDGITHNLALAIKIPQAAFVALLSGLLGAVWLLSRNPERALALLGAGSGFGHLLFGRYGWFDRYEVYVIALGLLSLAAATGPALSGLFRERGGMRFAAAAALLLALVLPRYALRLPDVPDACGNVQAQQIQLGRLVGEHLKQPVALNDLGAVAFYGRQPVLDLFGLASRRALKHRLGGKPGWLEREVLNEGFRFVLVYDEFFPGQIPPTWRRVGTLRLRQRRVSAAYSAIAFYAVDESAAQELRVALQSFEKGLPATAGLELAP